MSVNADIGIDPMNIIGLLLGILTAIAIIASGCQPGVPQRVSGSKNVIGIKAKTELPKIEVTATALSGNWKADCIRDQEKDELFRQDKIEITLDEISVSTEYFSDSSCIRKLYLQTLTGKFLLNGDQISIRYSALSVLPEASIIAVSFNQFDGFCALKDWEIEKIKNFDDLSTCGYPLKFESKVERYGSASGTNELFLGDHRFVAP